MSQVMDKTPMQHTYVFFVLFVFFLLFFFLRFGTSGGSVGWPVGVGLLLLKKMARGQREHKEQVNALHTFVRQNSGNQTNKQKTNYNKIKNNKK